MWTLRNEDRYLAWDFEQDVHNAYKLCLDQKVDGMFTDFPESLVRHLEHVYKPGTSASRRTANTLYWVFVVIAVSLFVVI